MMLSCFLFSFSSNFPKVLQPLIAVVCIICGLGIVGMVAVIGTPANYFYYAGLLLVFIFLYTLSGCSFLMATVAGWIIVVAYEAVAIYLIKMPFPILLNNNFFFIAANLSCMVAGFFMEKNERRNFLLTWRLEEEQKKVLAVNRELEHRVEERTSQYREAREQLEQSRKLSAIGMLAASIAHEFGTPIFAIRNYLATLQKGDHTDPSILQLGIQECGRLADLLNGLRNFNQPAVGEKKVMDLHRALDDAVLLLQQQLTEKNISVERQFAASSGKVVAVEDQIHQVILNLLTNAVDTIGDKGGRIMLETAVRDGFFLFTVSDSGVGIAEEIADRLFEPFISTKDKKIGTGLGLAIAYGIVKKHGGEITVQSPERHGASFTVALPLAMQL